MKNNIFAVGVVALIIGGVIGYSLNATSATNQNNMGGMHRMPDGSMMGNNGSMESMMDDMNAALRGKTGDEFDKAFLQEMIVHHEGAVDMAEQVLANSKRPELIKLAQDIIAAQTQEINQMKEWQRSWFNQ